MNIKTVGVVGAGQMGNGIAQVIAAQGITVLMMDQNPAALEKGVQTISGSCDRLIKKEKMTADQKAALLKNVQTTTTLSDFAKCDFVIEAVSENIQLKLKIFAELDKVCPPHAILTTNTSSISVTMIAASTKRPDKVAGMHWMNPVPLMLLVEGIRGMQTSDETWKAVKDLSEKAGKTFVQAKDSPGFVVNRILMPMINEAFFVLQEGLATPEDIDNAMKLGTNQPMGPLMLADFVGLDTCLAITQVLHQGLGEDKYRPCPLLVKYVEAGWYGKKVGRGVYKHEGK